MCCEGRRSEVGGAKGCRHLGEQAGRGRARVAELEGVVDLGELGEARFSTSEASATSLASASLQASEQKSLPCGVEAPQLVQTSSPSHEESSSAGVVRISEISLCLRPTRASERR